MITPADELYYGGSPGGGKTDLLLGLAVTVHRDSLILRREYSQMTGAKGIIDRSREIIGERGKYNGQEHTWRDIDGERSIEFGGLPYEHNKHRYQGRPHDLKGFDEITEFTRSQFEFINLWNRSTTPGQRCRVVATGNPPTNKEGRWIVDYWRPWLDDKHPNPAQQGELRWFVNVDGKSKEVKDGGSIQYQGETLYPRSRTYIHAELADNPYLGNDYLAVLQNAPEPLRSILLNSDFSASLQDDVWQIIPTAHIKAAQARWTADGWRGKHLDAIGVDVARGGPDSTSICFRFGEWFGLHSYPGSMTPNGESVVMLIRKLLLDEYDGVDFDGMLNIDLIGVGSSVYDEAQREFANVNGINAALASQETDKSGQYRLRNVRAVYHWRLREALKPKSGVNLQLPPSSSLLGDLTAPTYKVTASGILIEKKEDIKERLGRSPDEGESVMLAHHQPSIGIYI